MFTQAYKLACATGFKGTEQEFISALRHSPKKDHKMDFGQTNQSSASAQETTVNQVAPGKDTFLQLMVSLFGPQILEAMQPATIKPVDDMGMYQPHPGSMQGPTGNPGPAVTKIPENIIATAEDKTIQNYISAKMIPSFLKELSDLLVLEDGQERLRQQRRVIERMAKLMKYQAKPETIVPTAIHDEHELAIYKHVVAKQIVSRNMSVADGVDRVNNAIEAMNDRTIASKENKLRQAAEHHKANRDRIVDERLTELTRVSATTPIGETVRRLKEIATEYDPEATGMAHEHLVVQLLDSLGKRVMALPKPPVDYRSQTVATPTTAKEAYKEVLNSAIPERTDIRITLDPSDTRPLDNILPSHQRQIMSSLGGLNLKEMSGHSGWDSLFQAITQNARLGAHGSWDLHPMNGALGQGMMVRPSRNAE